MKNVSDEEFFSALKTVFNVLPTMLSMEVHISLTDTERHVISKPAESFERDSIGETTARAIKTRERQITRKTIKGFPIVIHTIPVINECTGNVLGAIIYAISQEKELNLLEISKDLKSHAENLAAATMELSSANQVLAGNSQDICITISETRDNIEKTDEIINYIKNIAETTNLLGLNAAIEAARANEHGRGFAVVANEIRKLAHDSKESSLKITNMLISIKNDINKVNSLISDLAAISQEQAAQSEQIAASSQNLRKCSEGVEQLAGNLLS